MCGTNDLQLNLCYKEQHEDTTTPSSSSSSSSSSNVEKVWKETQQLMEDSEQLVRIMTHVCSQQFSGAYRTLARYSQGCWRGCSAEGSNNSSSRRRGPSCHYVHPPPHSPPPPSSSSSSSPPPPPHHPSCPCAGRTQPLSTSSCEGSGPSNSSFSPPPPNCQTTSTHHSYCNHHPPHQKHHQQYHHHHHHLQQEESTTSAATCSSSSCRWRGGWGRRWRRRWGRCQCAHCHQGCSCSSTMMDSGGSRLPPSQPPSPAASSTETTTTTVITTTNKNHQQYPVLPCRPTHATSHTPTTTPTNARTAAPPPQEATSPKSRSGLPSHPSPRSGIHSHPSTRSGLPSHHSILTILLLLVVTLARFTDGCSSRSTPKPRPASPTMRPNITFQTFVCPPAYAAWYCLNGATCFTVKIGESILYNCECADGYMGQRCEFKDLDGSYLPAREKVLLETASIAGGATVACVFVFIVLFAVYVFMQKDKDKRCRDLDDGRDSDRQPFTGYQNPRPEMFRTISNPYARTIDELSHVEVQSAGHGNTGNGRNGSGNTGGGLVDSNVHGAQQPS